jgi:type II secretion system protein I
MPAADRTRPQTLLHRRRPSSSASPRVGGALPRSGKLMRPCSRGFTLIEVVVALVVVSLGMLGVIQAVGQTASNSGYLREKTIAHWVAMNRLTEVRLEQSAPKVAKTSDDIEMAGRRFRWTMNVTQTPVESIRRIDISVRPEDADERSSLASITGYYGTAVAPPGSTPVDWQGAAAAGGPGQNGGGEDRPKTDEPKNEEPPDETPVPEEQPETEE